MNKSVLLLCLLLALAGCSHDNPVETGQIPDNQPSYVQTRFDLQTGFSNRSVRIQIDSLIYFSAYLSGIVPVAGPEAYFMSHLTRSQHRLIVITYSTVLRADTLLLPLGNSQSYFVGIRSAGDSVYVIIQDKTFLYM